MSVAEDRDLRVRDLRRDAGSLEGDGHTRLATVARTLLLTVFTAAVCAVVLAPPAGAQWPLRVRVTLPDRNGRQPVTGRVFVILTKVAAPEPRMQIGSEVQPPTFAAAVDQRPSGDTILIDTTTPGFPLATMRDIPAGDYHVQALLNVYTQFTRADGHVIWAHMDQWEGQDAPISPGNWYSDVRQLHLDPAQGIDLTLALTHVIPPLPSEPDTRWLKHVKIQSPLLSKFWGRPIFLGATVLLPRGYDTHTDVRYPVIYKQGHFGQIPFFFNDDPTSVEGDRYLEAYHLQTGYDFYQSWSSDHFPRFIAVTLHHPTPYFDDSYAVNSANNGPYGDAIMGELLPYLETHFRIIQKPYARLLEGASTGGWEALALQLYHPDFFGGTWVHYPDPIDFRHYLLIDIYRDDNAFVVSRTGRSAWIAAERPWWRSTQGQVGVTMRQVSRLEEVLGTRGRSTYQLEGWESVFAPVGADGYPKPLWNKLTGTIDHHVAEYMRDHGYDLRDYAERNWARLATQLEGKIHMYVGDMDNYYLNLAVYDFEAFMKRTQDPHDGGAFFYGRPMEGHGWHSKTFADLIREMADYVRKTAPAGEPTTDWSY
jgi:hypothetical protein